MVPGGAVADRLSMPSYFARVVIWTWTASRGIAECLHVLCMLTRVMFEAGNVQFLKLAKVWLIRLVTGGSTTLLCGQLVQTNFWPGRGDDVPTTLLAINSLLHWMWLLLQLRALPATGKKLLPIIKSIKTVAPMLLIVFFLMMAFVHSFWALDLEMAGDVRFFEVANLLFTGENLFVSRQDLDDEPAGKRVLLMGFTLTGLFVFLACALNIFIAVMGDCYDLEQERMTCSFLQERARICCSACLGLKLHRNGVWPGAAATFLAAAVIVVGVVVHMFVSAALGAWAVAAGLASTVELLSAWRVANITHKWSDRYLWLCYRDSVDEHVFLTAAVADDAVDLGRSTRLKQHLHCRVQDMEDKMGEMMRRQDSLLEMMGQQSSLLERQLEDQAELRAAVSQLRASQREQGEVCRELLQLQQAASRSAGEASRIGRAFCRASERRPAGAQPALRDRRQGLRAKRRRLLRELAALPQELPGPPGAEAFAEQQFLALCAGARVDLNEHGYPLRADAKDCQHYVNTGECKYGAQCRYNHPCFSRASSKSGDDWQKSKWARGSWEEWKTGKDENWRKEGRSDSGDAWHQENNSRGYVASERWEDWKTGMADTWQKGAPPKQQEWTDRYAQGRDAEVKLNESGYPRRADAKDCEHYVRTGECKFGAQCRYNHPSSGRASSAGQWAASQGQDSTSRQSAWQSDASHASFQTARRWEERKNGKAEHWQQENKESQPRQQEWREPREWSRDADAELNAKGFPLRPGEQDCQHYVKTGECKFGAQCKWNHPEYSSRIPAFELALSRLCSR
ncbi:unnamed protein product [Prorocentrum cordatum]|uniref:C3H1-type domain-containing protein n=1 Tax=Prorocentrum cordatum TaxID=2364126 RepID=A0ABN9V491_9DINO|nr:unnamed protein product [Polarella glacialis]